MACLHDFCKFKIFIKIIKKPGIIFLFQKNAFNTYAHFIYRKCTKQICFLLITFEFF